MTKDELYVLGIEASNQVLDLNGIERPSYRTYVWQEELGRALDRHSRYFTRVRAADRRTVGAGTGLYYDGVVWVNVTITALPVAQPGVRSWSWPAYKVDRTAVGVVAHEVGHHIESVYVAVRKDARTLREAWRTLCSRERITGYEPVPSEAWAETVRLFILNPDLLRKACPCRYNFITVKVGLRPVPALLKRGWRKVIGNKEYFAAAERWVGIDT